MKKRKKNHSTQIKTFSTNSNFMEATSASISIKKKLDMRENKITNLGQPTYEEDIVSLGYLRSKFLDKKDEKTGYLPTEGGNMHGEISMGGSCIKNVQFPVEEKKYYPKTIKKLSEQEKNSAVNAVSVLRTINTIKDDSYLNQVDQVIQELQPKVKVLEDLLRVEPPPGDETNSDSVPELPPPQISRWFRERKEETLNRSYPFSVTQKNNEVPYVKTTGDSMTGDLKMNGGSVYGLPASPQKETDAVSLGYLRTKFACGGCIMQGPIALSSKTSDPTALSNFLTLSTGNIINLRTPSTTELSHGSNLEFIKHRLPGANSSFLSTINESKAYVLKNGNFIWGVGINQQSPESYKYASISGTSLQLKPHALYTLYWTAIVSINSSNLAESRKDSQKAVSSLSLKANETTNQGKLTLKLMAPLSSTKDPESIINKTTPDPDTGETPPEPKPEPIASITTTYSFEDSFVSLSSQIPLSITASQNPETMGNTDTYSLYLEFSSSVKIEYSSWNLLIRPLKE
ncbi:hypothetical protein [Chlamydiifrater volucris]|uniref:hypothetical protein n=1 Tax=Chlamydiifrater volucris TaxID=2681470 RepID=UPI0032B101DF